ncbi:hypothetical protein [Microbacterium album]|uniref:Uncharacterized protein n=1 Tax=Microbacterium album TaxID=2053191 RepID=A0A917IGN5_9MICO|nr:hypothetical protein [Microbacterium album]GGH50351.1 hypothetical protein GCM10010921_29050 [Microbacterium album]
MSGPDELYPPAQYGVGWLLLALGILAALVALAWLVVLLTRSRAERQPPPAPPAPVPLDVLAQLRHEYGERIDRIEQAYRAGELDPRRANAELSRAVREFVNEYSGLEAPVMTLQDLAARGVHPALLDALQRHYYPSIFRSGPPVDPIAGAAAAREVVAAWH